MPTNTIIILERDGGRRFRVALWNDVPLARQQFYADPLKTSAWKGASALENSDLQAGKVVEVIEEISVPAGATLAQIQALLLDRWTDRQQEVQTVNPWVRYGTRRDGTGTWIAAGIA
jgi:hypothetical protein